MHMSSTESKLHDESFQCHHGNVTPSSGSGPGSGLARLKPTSKREWSPCSGISKIHQQGLCLGVLTPAHPQQRWSIIPVFVQHLQDGGPSCGIETHKPLEYFIVCLVDPMREHPVT